MKTNLHLPRLTVITALLAAFFALLPAQAPAGSSNQIVIQSAVANLTTNVLTITGSNFGNTPPAVTLNNNALVVNSSSPTTIQAAIPPGFAPGSYLLTVSTGNGTPFNATFEVTAVGSSLGFVVLTGGTPGPIGCIYCDGQQRVVAPGVPYMSSNPANVGVPLPAGTLTNLRVKLSSVDLDSHNFTVYVNGVGTPLYCITYTPPYTGPGPRFDQCQSAAGVSVTINAGDLVSIQMGDGGAFFDPGNEVMRFSMIFTPSSQ